MTYGEMGMTEGSNKIAALSPKAHDNRRLILNIFTYKWGKCVKHVGKYLLESLI
jgi:hypothetical protein